MKSEDVKMSSLCDEECGYCWKCLEYEYRPYGQSSENVYAGVDSSDELIFPPTEEEFDKQNEVDNGKL